MTASNSNQQPLLTMPANFGSNIYAWDGKNCNFVEEHAIVINYVTDRKKLQAILPPGFTAPENPLITAYFSMCKGVDIIGGHSYNLLGINAQATFEGKKDKQSGSFCFVMWENNFVAVAGGREIIGVPKLVVDIQPAWIKGDRMGYRASENGSCFIEAEVSNLKKMTDEECKSFSKSFCSAFDSGSLWMNWKYIPSCSGEGKPDVSYILGVPVDYYFTEAWVAEGKLDWHHLPPEIGYFSWRIIDGMMGLPNLGYHSAFVAKGPTCLRIHKSRALE